MHLRRVFTEYNESKADYVKKLAEYIEKNGFKTWYEKFPEEGKESYIYDTNS